MYIYPFHLFTTTPMFPPFPQRESCETCCETTPPKITGIHAFIAADEDAFSFQEWKWELLKDAPAGFAAARIKAHQDGYKIYVDGHPCGRGADIAPAYLNLKEDDDGASIFSITEDPRAVGTSLPLLAFIGKTGTYPTDETLLTVLSVDTTGYLLRVATMTGRQLSAAPDVYNGCGVIEGQKIHIDGLTQTGNRLQYGEPFTDNYALAGGIQ